MQGSPIYNASRFLRYLQDSPVYIPSGYTQDRPAYNISLIMPPPVMGGGIKQSFCMTSV